eukprot:2868285-Amphidinium_carterae.1
MRESRGERPDWRFVHWAFSEHGRARQIKQGRGKIRSEAAGLGTRPGSPGQAHRKATLERAQDSASGAEDGRRSASRDRWRSESSATTESSPETEEESHPENLREW